MAERTGLYVAATMAGIFILLVLVFAMRGGGAGAQSFGDETELPPGVTPLTSPVGSGMYVELADKDDPTRRAGLITAESVEPLGPIETDVTQPRVWYYLRDGRTLHVEADKGRFFFPGGQRNSAPEYGHIQGDVKIRVYDPVPGGERPVIGRDEPLLTATAVEPLEFDLRNARLATTGRVVITTPEVEFAGSYLTAVINQVKERLELLEIRKGEHITFTPSEPEDDAVADGETTSGDANDAEPDALTTAADSGTTGAPGAPASPAAPKIDEYQISFLDGVEITRATQRAWADKLDLWVRLRDNTITADAFGGPLDSSSSASDPASDPAADEPAVTDTLTDGKTNEPPAPGEPITLKWTGALVAKPLNTSPGELEGTDLAFRLTAEKTGLVRGEDPTLGVTGHMVALEGRAASREFIISGPGGTIDLDWQGTGRYVGSRAMISLSAGTIHSRGPTVLEGVLDPGATGAAGPRGKIRCTEQADFQFSVVDGMMTQDLERVTFLGDVEATDGEARLEGAEALTALFVPVEGGPSRLAQIEVEGGIASDGQGQSASADRMRIDLAPGVNSDELDPTRFIADGGVQLASGDASLRAERVDAGLARNEDADVIVTEVYAAGAVEYDGSDDTWAKADEMRGDGVLQQITVLGSPAQVGKGGALISGFEIDLDGVGRGAQVYGPGRFEMDDSVEAPQRLSGIAWASWQEGMVFDDYAGRIELTGGAKAESRPDALTLDSLSADRVVIEFTPMREPGSSEAEGAAGETTERELVRVRAYGRAGPVATQASVETRIYALDAPERAEQVYFLEGLQIDAEVATNTLSVPSPGKMLSLDRRPEAIDAERPEGLPLIARGPGQALITWEGSMSLERTTGEAILHDSTRIVHQSLLDGRYTELESEDLVVRFRELAGEGGAGALRGELVYADATGAVYFRNGSRELIADRARYDAQQGELAAIGSGANSVTLFDASRPAPIRSRAIIWDLVTDRIDVNAPVSSAIPLGADDAP